MKLYLKNLFTFAKKTDEFYSQHFREEIIDGEIDDKWLRLLIEINLNILNPLLEVNLENLTPLAQLLEEIYKDNDVIIKITQHLQHMMGLFNIDTVDFDKESVLKLLSTTKFCQQYETTTIVKNSGVKLEKLTNDVTLYLNGNDDEKLASTIVNQLILLNRCSGLNIIYPMAASVNTLLYVLLMTKWQIRKPSPKGGYIPSNMKIDLVEFTIHVIGSKIQYWIYSEFIMDLLKDNLKDVYRDKKIRTELSRLFYVRKHTTREGFVDNLMGVCTKQIQPCHVHLFKSAATNLGIELNNILAEQILQFYHVYYKSGGFDNFENHCNLYFARIIQMYKLVCDVMKKMNTNYKPPNVAIDKIGEMFYPIFQHLIYPNPHIMKEENSNKFMSGPLSSEKLFKLALPFIKK